MSTKLNATKKARMSYGPKALDVSPDVSTSELDEQKTEFYGKYVKVSDPQIQQIFSSILEQSQSGLWHTERSKKTHCFKRWLNCEEKTITANQQNCP